MHSWSTRTRSVLLRRLQQVPAALGSTTVLGLCGAAWAVMAFGSIDPMAGRHLFYLPIVVAGARFGARAGMATALAGTALIEPLGSGMPLTTWFAVGASFVLVGWAVGSVSSAHVEERERVEREHALARERRELVQLVSDEVRTPLTVIRGSVDSLLARRPDGQDQQDLLEATARATVRLEEMLDVVLAAADRPDPRPLPADQPGA